MKIELKEPHKSIQTLTTDELPDFAVLIGRNGAGKTQLLEALNEGWAVVPGVTPDETELYDMGSFRSPNGGGANRQANGFARSTVEAYLLSPSGGQPLIQTAADIFNQVAGDIEREARALVNAMNSSAFCGKGSSGCPISPCWRPVTTQRPIRKPFTSRF